MRVRRWLAAVAVLALAATACAGSPKDAAEEFIMGDLADQIGLGALTATCDDPGEADVGDRFDCTATTSDGGVIEFVALMEDADTVDVSSTNLILARALPAVEEGAVTALEDAVGLTLGIENFDCGEATVILDDGTLTCTLTDPANGDLYDAIVTIEDMDTLALGVVVADAPRS